MNEDQDLHVPTDAFRASLERTIVHNYRTQSRFRWSSVSPRFSQMRTAAALVIGLFLGAGTGIASAQVKGAQQREQISSATVAALQLAQLQLELAKENLALTERRVAAGAASRDALSQVNLELRTAEMSIARIGIDSEESRVTSQPPRNELWAPLVSGRDFVKERLMIDANLARERSRDQARITADIERKVRVGLSPDVSLLEMQIAYLKNNQDLALSMEKLNLRKRFLSEKLTPEFLNRSIQLLELKNDLQVNQMGANLAEQRLSLLKKRVSLGVEAELEVKRAELDLLERVQQLEQLQRQLKLLEGGKPE